VKISFDVCLAVTYPQPQENKGFFCNLTTVLPISSLVRNNRGLFGVRCGGANASFWGKRSRIGKTAARFPSVIYRGTGTWLAL
jgi:hypothetical protein